MHATDTYVGVFFLTARYVPKYRTLRDQLKKGYRQKVKRQKEILGATQGKI